jgi:hypothetical protein
MMIRYVMPQGLTSNVAGIPLTTAGTFTPPMNNFQPVRFAVTTDKDTVGNQIKVICTDASQAIACYTYNCNNPDLWDSSFIGAMQDAVAGAIVIPLTGKIQLARGLIGQANESILAARANDGNEGLTVYDSLPDWIRTRGYAAYAGLNPSMSLPWGPLFSLPTI